jgi:hypothetical protein
MRRLMLKLTTAVLDTHTFRIIDIFLLNDKATVERRKHPGLFITQSVTLLVLGTLGAVIEACVLDLSTSEVQVRSPTRLTCATHVKIEGDDAVMLGTVCRCEAHDGAYRIGIQLSDPLSSLLDLELLNRAFIGPRIGNPRH